MRSTRAEERVTAERHGGVEGRIVEPLPNALFRVALDDGREVLAHVSGRLRLSIVRLLPGDRVRVELAAYDQRRGRIVAWRQQAGS